MVGEKRRVDSEGKVGYASGPLIREMGSLWLVIVG